jgi:hypothetical protein
MEAYTNDDPSRVIGVGSSAKADEMLQTLNLIKQELLQINPTAAKQIVDTHEQLRHVQVVSGTVDKPTEEILALFKESLTKANAHIEDFLYQIETGERWPVGSALMKRGIR